MEKIPKFNKCRAFDKAVGPGKNPKLINVGPTFIPESRVLFGGTGCITLFIQSGSDFTTVAYGL